ncbi:MAG: YqeG family HAD IIIA-type phosphatase [Vampirovibrionales bacterium]|nr:YqeG family HAD IIIA-type phosphatase [Vampirovibrionales bacterium]
MFLRPDLVLTSVEQLTPDVLAHQGIRGLLLDLDNTLIPPKCGLNPPESVLAWLDVMRASGVAMVVVSNNKRDVYVREAGERLGLPAIAYAAKPFGPGLKTGLQQLQLLPQQVAVVGDKPLTDIWGGVSLGCKTVLVRSQRAAACLEPGWMRFLRRLERLILTPDAQAKSAMY